MTGRPPLKIVISLETRLIREEGSTLDTTLTRLMEDIELEIARLLGTMPSSMEMQCTYGAVEGRLEISKRSLMTPAGEAGSPPACTSETSKDTAKWKWSE